MKRYEFSLSEVDSVNVVKKYDLISETGDDILEIGDDVSTDTKHSTTMLSKLNDPPGSSQTISFLDEAKRPVMCNISTVDLSGNRESILLQNCFWCKHPFDTKPIGCPIRYIPRQAVKKYTSGISKDVYTIKENITNKRANSLVETDVLKLQEGDYYETDGCFCWYPCCQAWINDNKHNRMYDHSSMLLLKMFRDEYGMDAGPIVPASHWRTLNVYGGFQTIVQFRENFNKIEHEYHGTLTPRPKFLPIAQLFEDRYRF